VFNPDGTVSVDPIICTVERRRTFFAHLLLMFVGGSRDASAVLNGQSNHTVQNLSHLRKLRSLVDRFWNVLTQQRDLRELGVLLHEGWECKKRLATNVSNPRIDDCYERARRSGALGGKILGAGAGGFLLLFCEPSKQDAVRNSLPDLREIEFRYEAEGSKIIYVGS
jgi:D-glycero-alpha-D-manno-heptose-7-phosphate kinase